MIRIQGVIPGFKFQATRVSGIPGVAIQDLLQAAFDQQGQAPGHVD